MYPKNDFKYFLTVIDVFSRKIFVEILKDKSAASTKKAFIKIFDEIPTEITKLECDAGTEFTGLTSFFKERHIYFHIKTGKNKANFAEHAIFLIKRRLYTTLRAQVSDNWPKYLPLVVASFNKTHLKILGNLAPEDIKSEFDDPMVRESQEKSGVNVYKEPSWEEQNSNQEEYLKSTKNIFKPGAFCYVDKKIELFDKSFFSQVN